MYRQKLVISLAEKTHRYAACATIARIVIKVGAGSVATCLTSCALYYRASATPYAIVQGITYSASTLATIVGAVLEVDADTVAARLACCTL